MRFGYGPICGFVSWDLWWVRLTGRGMLVKRTPALFSERHGYRVPFACFGRWRAFWLRSWADVT